MKLPGIINHSNLTCVCSANPGVCEFGRTNSFSRGFVAMANMLLKYCTRACALLIQQAASVKANCIAMRSLKRSIGVSQNTLVGSDKVTTPGFSILEIVMVMAISAIIMTCLFEIYNQTARNMARVERFVFEDTQVITLKKRFGKDISGLSAIWFKEAEVEKLIAAQEKKEESKDFKKRSFYFYSTNKEGHFDTLTFITTNPLRSYGKVIDRFVRVVYRLEKDPAHQDLFRLMRKEIAPATEFIDEKTFETGRFYELIGGIKSLEITYQLVDRMELNKQFKAGIMKKGNDAAQDQQEVKQIIRAVKKWTPAESIEKPNDKKPGLNTSEVDGDEDEKEDLGGAPVPKFIEMKIVFGKTLQQQEREYSLGFYVPSTVDNMPKSIFAVRPAPKNPVPPVAQNPNSGNAQGGVNNNKG